MRSNIKKVFWFYFLLFLILIIYILFFTIFESKNLVGNSYNPRVKYSQNTDIIRGSILDKNFNVLAETKDGVRHYLYNDIFAHTIGYIDKGGYGIESKYNFYLQTLNNDLLQRITNKLNKNINLQANSLILTLDKDLQQYCYNKLKGKKGSIVIMDSTTGKILAMVSSPSFNPNNVAKNWDTLSKDIENNPLINKATQGLYPPASVFKIITALAFMENYPDYENYTYNCKGYETYGDIKITCFDKKAHGTLNLEDALSVSCNSFFINLSNIIKPNDVLEVANKSLFNQDLDFDLPYKKSSFVLNNNSSKDEIMQTYIGQGKTLVTPLHIALIGSAIANNGIMMKPYIVECIIDYNGHIVNKNLPKKLTNSFSVQNAQAMKNMLKKVITSGTGKKAQVEGVSIAGKTGTAQVEGEKDHAWFLGIAPTENPNFVISIMLENTGSHSNISDIAGDIISFYKHMLNKK